MDRFAATETKLRDDRRELIRRVLGVGGLLAACAVVLIAVRSVAHQIDYDTLIRALRHTSHAAIGWSLLWTGVSFAALVGRDACALRYAGVRPPLSATLLAGFCGTALGNAVGFGTLTGGTVRYRIYGAVGVKPDEIARVMLFIAWGFAVGMAGFASAAISIDAGPAAQLLGWTVPALRIAGGAGLFFTLLAVIVSTRGRLRLGRFTLEAPSLALAVVQLLLTVLDLLAASAALWVLLPAASVDFGSFAAIFATATALGVVSHVPGGIGVFEAVVVFALHRGAQSDIVAASLIAYRGIYFLLPLLLSAMLLALFELRLAAGRAGKTVGPRLARSAARLTPSFVGVIAFAAGIMLIVSGATPSFGHRLAILSVRLPLWAVEGSHFVGSLTGVLMLFVARGLFHRLDAAWWLALLLAAANIFMSIAKGLAYGEATIFALLILLLLATRQQFGRPASLLRQPFTVSWFVAVGAIIVASFFILLFAFRDVPYTRDLWWQFEFDAQAPRALRATLGVAVLAIALALVQLLRPPKGFAARPGPEALQRAAAIVRTQEQSAGQLALMGDKSLMFSSSGYAFLMFARRGRSWIALFDPIGPRTEWPELIWRFVELADSHGGRAAFYQVRPDSLPLYLDAGLKIMKLGEEAVVPLAGFELAGAKNAKLRYTLGRGEREGLAFELLEPGQAGVLMAELAAISDEWLGVRRGGEKGFSVAAFERGFVTAQSVAVLRQKGRPVAFATVMTTGLKGLATVGLMRHTGDASPYAMEFLFIRLILAFKEAGYRSLSLGMAPLSGLEPRPLSSRWHRLGGLIWQHGNRVYNFQGLRLFKGKFGPVWEPRYLAASGTIGPFVALADAASLAGGGKGTTAT